MDNIEPIVTALNQQSRYAESLHLLDGLVEESLSLLGLMHCNQLNNPLKGVEYLTAAAKLNPGSWVVLTNLCHAYNLAEKYEEALQAAMQSVKISRGIEADAWYNTGVILGNLGRIEDAIEYYKQALFLRSSPSIRHNLSNMLLALGRYEEGWIEYEYRLTAFKQTYDFTARFKQPIWDGIQSLKDKTIIVFNEQGVGDLVHFSRYIPILKDMGAIVWLECQEKIAKLFEASNLGIDKVIPRPDSNFPLPPMTDYAVSVCSLPCLLKIHEISFSPPYLKFAPSNAKIEPGDKWKIGLCWAGNHTHPRDFIRTCPINNFLPLASCNNIQLYSLQKDSNPIRKWGNEVININSGVNLLNMIDLSSQINDFNDTACLIKQLDLVITVDTSVAHIAGALGCPVIILLPTNPDWRWLRNGNSTFWYPTMQIIRQKEYKNWTTVIEEVVQTIQIQFG